MSWELTKGTMNKLKKNIAISESGFIFNPTTGDSFSVNELGKIIIEALKAEKSYNELAEEVILEYDVTRGAFQMYYLDFIKTLKLFEFIDE